jgi:adenylosuccinate synthase
MLDVLHGSQPYTTSSGCTLGALSAAMGIYHFDAVIGVAKAYATRVGAGPFPTCLTTGEGDELRRRGNEYGATTGRPRACGWIDLPALSYACRMGGITHLILTKLDILSDFPTDIAVCSEYRYNGRVVSRTETLTTAILEGSDLGYTHFAPWSAADLQTARTSERVQSYLAFIERATGVPIGGIKTSPERTALTLLE